MMAMYMSPRHDFLVAVTGGGVQRVSRHVLPRVSFMSMSPSGKQAFANDANTGTPLLIDLSNGRTAKLSRPKGWPGRNFGALTDTGQYLFQPDDELGNSLSASSASSGFYVWATSGLLVVRDGGSSNSRGPTLFLNTRNHHWYVDRSRVALGTYCPLPTGNVLFARWSGLGATQLYLFKVAQQHLDPIDTSSLGRIYNMSCDPHGSSVFVSAGHFPATLYEARATAIDGSPWTAK